MTVTLKPQEVVYIENCLRNKFSFLFVLRVTGQSCPERKQQSFHVLSVADSSSGAARNVGPLPDYIAASTVVSRVRR